MSAQSGVGAVTFSRLRYKSGREGGGLLDANQTISIGQPLAQIVGTAQNQKTTFSVSGGTPSSGQATFLWMGKVFTLAYNSTAAAAQTLLRNLFGVENITVTGGAWPGSALVVETTGVLGNLTQGTPALQSHTLSAGTPSAAITQTAIPVGRYVLWDPTKIASPASAPSVTANGTGSAFVAGSHSVSYSWTGYDENGNVGETLVSPAVDVVLTAAQNLRFAAISPGNVPTGATGVNIYVNGQRAVTVALSSGAVPQTDVAGWTSGTNTPLPAVNNAFKYTDGRAKFAGLALLPATTGPKGNPEQGNTAVPTVMGATHLEGLFISGGYVYQADISTAIDWTEVFRQRPGSVVMSGAIANSNATIAVQPIGHMNP